MTKWKEWPRKWRILKYWLRLKTRGSRNLNLWCRSIRMFNHYLRVMLTFLTNIIKLPHPHPTSKLMVQGPCLASASPPTQAAVAASVRLMLKKDFTAHKPTTSIESHGSNHPFTEAPQVPRCSFVNLFSFKAALNDHVIITIMMINYL